MARYSLISLTDFSIIVEGQEHYEQTPPDFTGHPTKSDQKWVPYTVIDPGPLPDEALYLWLDPIVTVDATQHTVEKQYRAKTQQELDQEDSDLKDSEVERFDTDRWRAIFEWCYDQENRIRTLEGLGTVTRAQVKTAIRNKLDLI